MQIPITRILGELEQQGFVVLRPGGYESCVAALEEIGPTVDRAVIDVDPLRDQRLHSDRPMSLHNDHPLINVIAWYCHEQSDAGGASLLLDGLATLEKLDPKRRESLTKVMVQVPAVLGTRKAMVPLYSTMGLYYSDWLLESRSVNDHRDALEAFQKLIESAAPIRITLEEGEVLIIDNKRMLHGREGIQQVRKRRTLYRHWLIRPGVGGSRTQDVLRRRS